MKIEIKLIRSQSLASPRKKTLMRIAALLALLALVLAIPASAKYVGEGSAVFSTALDSVAYKVTAPITLTGGDTIGITPGMWMPDYSVPGTRLTMEGTGNLTRSWTMPETGFVHVYAHASGDGSTIGYRLSITRGANTVVDIPRMQYYIIDGGTPLAFPSSLYFGTQCMQVKKGDVITIAVLNGVLRTDDPTRVYADLYAPVFVAF